MRSARAYLYPWGVLLRVVSILLLLLFPRPSSAQTLYAAASLSSALQELAPLYDGDLRLSIAGSSTLARQIEAGAPADLYFAANSQWMDYLQQQGLLADSTRGNILANSLVLIAPIGERFTVDLTSPNPPVFTRRLALGDPTHVPAGLYAEQALKKLGWWAALRRRLAPAADVRVALTYVERGECGAGLVYATDARISRKVTVVATLPDSLHEPIVYPLAIVRGRSNPQTLRLLSFLRSVRAATVFKKHGFKALTNEPADAR